MKSAGLKRKLLLCFIAFASFTIFTECLNRATNKNFWGDEATDLETTLAVPSGDLLVGKMQNQQTGSPLYFIVQREFIRKALRDERAAGAGWDWRVSMRLVPAFWIALSALVSAVLLARMSWIMAMLVPAMLAIQSHVTWFGAETRPFAPWLGASLIFYVVSIQYGLNPKSRNLGIAWILSAVQVIAISITAPVQIFLAAIPLVFLTNLRKHYRYLLAGAVITVLLFKVWNVQGKGIKLSHAKETLSFYLHHFRVYALMAFGGDKGTIKFLLECAGLIAFWKVWPKHERSKAYLLVAAICLSQLVATAAVYAGQILSGYFFADRHSIFGDAARVLAIAGFAAASADALVIAGQRYRFKALKVYAPMIVVLALLFDWFHWTVMGLPSSLHALAQARVTYCHGPVQPSSPAKTSEEVLNAVNLLRHQGRCVSSKNEPGAVSFDPDWIYGNR